MAKEFKDYENEYKKCLRKSKDFTVQYISKLEKRIYYFHHDAVQGFDALYEAVAGAKGDNYGGKKIEDYAKENKEITAILKHIDHSQAKQKAGLAKLNDVNARARPSELALTKLKMDISRDLKKLGKGVKPDPDILKLQKQIDTNLKEIKDFLTQGNKIDPILLNPDDEYDDRIKQALNAKPIKSKFTKIADTMLTLKTLKEKRDVCKKARAALKHQAATVAKFAKQKNLDEKAKETMNSVFLDMTDKYQDILDIDHEYTAIQKKWKQKITDHKDGAVIEKAIKVFQAAKKEAEKTHDEAEAAVKKVMA